jgi:hypothetical protein
MVALFSSCAKAESNVPFWLQNFHNERWLSASVARLQAGVSHDRFGKFVKQHGPQAIAI